MHAEMELSGKGCITSLQSPVKSWFWMSIELRFRSFGLQIIVCGKAEIVKSVAWIETKIAYRK
jgi:hypothetical protein